jgi:broad specificity phosphatase PhoE
VTTYLVRHAKAENRRDWDGPDELRPLTKAGRRQADGLVEMVGAAGITRIVTSPSLRCRETMRPLAEHVHAPIEVSDALAEGSSLVDALRQLEKVTHEQVALCSHGDVLGDLLNHFARQGVRLDDDRCEKGSVWALEVEDGAVTAASYLPPPG